LLIFFMLRARMIKIGKRVKRDLAIALFWTKHVSFSAAISGQIAESFHPHVPRCRRIPITRAASASDYLQRSVEHSRKHTVLEPLMQVADFPEFFFDPARFHFLLELAERSG